MKVKVVIPAVCVALLAGTGATYGDRGRSSAQHILQLAAIDALVGDQYQSPMIITDHASEADRPSYCLQRRAVRS